MIHAGDLVRILDGKKIGSELVGWNIKMDELIGTTAFVRTIVNGSCLLADTNTEVSLGWLFDIEWLERVDSVGVTESKELDDMFSEFYE